MARCPKCTREMPLSGRCPFCEKAAPATGGFSLNRLSARPPEGATPDQPPAPPAGPAMPAMPPLPPSAPPAHAHAPLPSAASPSPAMPAVPPAHAPASAGAPISPGAVPPAARPGGILAGLRAKTVAPAAPSAVSIPPAAVPEYPVESADVAPVQEFGTPEPAAHAVPPHSAPRLDLPEIGADPTLGQSMPVAPPQAKGPDPFAAIKNRGIKDAAAMKRADQPVEKPEGPSVFQSHVTGFGDEEMECAVLAGLLNDHYILEQATSKGLVIELFSTRYSRALAKAVLALREENREGSMIDKIIIKNKLQQQGVFDSPMQNYLNRVLAQPTPTLDQVLHYLELLKDQGLKRKLKEISLKVGEFIEHPDPEKNLGIEQFTNQIIAEIREVQKAKTTKKINLVKEEMRDIIHDIDQREVRGEIEIIGYSFEPFHYLNIALSGFRKGFMYAIAGAPRRGKTTFTLELATMVATNNKIPVLFFTYEQTKKNLTYRLLAKEARLNPDSLQRKKIRSDMIMDAKFMGGWKKMQSYMDYFYIIEATKADTIDRIRSYAYNVMQDFNTDDIMIFIDYIQKMPLSRNYMDEKFKVEEISTDLKALSIELNNPIMTISSLSKEGCMIDATADSERPTMYHCKGSGDLEYDLDCAMIQAKDWGDTKELHQQFMQKAEEMGKDSTRVPKVDVVNLYLDKNRDAPEGIYSTMQYLFFIEDNKFIELGPKYDDDRFRYSKIEALVDDLIQRNYIVFHDRERDASYQKGRVAIKLKNV